MIVTQEISSIVFLGDVTCSRNLLFPEIISTIYIMSLWAPYRFAWFVQSGIWHERLPSAWRLFLNIPRIFKASITMPKNSKEYYYRNLESLRLIGLLLFHPPHPKRYNKWALEALKFLYGLTPILKFHWLWASLTAQVENIVALSGMFGLSAEWMGYASFPSPFPQLFMFLFHDFHYFSWLSGCLSWNSWFVSWNSWFVSWNSWFVSWNSWFVSWNSWFVSWNSWFVSWISWFVSWISWFVSWISWFVSWISWFVSWISWFVSLISWFVSLISFVFSWTKFRGFL